jgi:hypothetical protein
MFDLQSELKSVRSHRIDAGPGHRKAPGQAAKGPGVCFLARISCPRRAQTELERVLNRASTSRRDCELMYE